MNRRIALLIALLALPAWASATDLESLTSSLKSSPLTSMLTSQLGVTEKQATGGVGSILTLAQEKLIKGDFDKVAAVVPGASKYMDQAKKLGAVTGPIKDMNGLKSALGRLAMSPDTINKFVPAVSNFVGKAGGSEVGNLLAGVLK
ncbi:MAG TPA: DUF2780 domain-containing protein [Steroidobacteraceae bacterium]|jgi:hypothetical protein